MHSALNVHRNIVWVSSTLIFCFFALLYVFCLGQNAFGDTDSLWHIAAGDLIRSSGTIPVNDPWSFTAGDYRWLNISWAWDSAFSAIKEHFGWHGALAVNGIILGLTAALIYAACFLRCRHGIASFLATMGAVTLLYSYIRPQCITQLMIALWILVLGQCVRREWKAAWLVLLPISMIVWVNCHGGFIVGPLLIGAFFLQAVWERDVAMAKILGICGVASLIAIFCNPYGLDIIEAVRRPLMTSANRFISEWQPLTASPGDLIHRMYAVLFIALVINRALPVLFVERWLAYGWLVLGITSIRYLSVFAALSAPVFACRFAQLLGKNSDVTPLARRINTLAYNYATHKTAPLLSVMVAMLIGVFLLSPMAMHWQGELTSPFDLKKEIAYIKQHYPKGRFLNEFSIGGVLAAETRGEIPVFIDPRTETAYPASVIKDYAIFSEARPGWEQVLEKYDITGLILLNSVDNEMIRAFESRHGWKKVFTGPSATIIVRTQEK